jgi:hypothetical protein
MHINSRFIKNRRMGLLNDFKTTDARPLQALTSLLLPISNYRSFRQGKFAIYPRFRFIRRGKAFVFFQ